jgi:hypothetical protein
MLAANQLKEFQLVAGLICFALLVNIITKRDVCHDRGTTEVYSTASISSMLKEPVRDLR